ncbi:MAG: hypothetical protein ACT4OF_13620 [Caulobacteraceae bacterium]
MKRRTAIVACALLLVGCAHERIHDPEHPAVTTTAQFIIQALAPTESGDDYRWEAVTGRVSSSTQWGLPQHASTPDDDVGREGRLSARGSDIGVIATGEEENVTTLRIDANAFHALALLEALRRAGAEVSLQADYETYSEYVITPPGRDTGLLTTSSTCSPLERRPARDCEYSVTLSFNPF